MILTILWGECHNIGVTIVIDYVGVDVKQGRL